MLEVNDLTFTYPGVAAPTLRGLTFRIDRGEVYGLLGPSGAGKSTTQRILMGLLRGFGGEAKLFGVAVEAIGRDLYERIGVSFELPAIYLRLTALENLRLFAALYRTKTRDPREVLELVDLSDAADQRAETFSKGMKMRLNLARSLLNNPEILFLDEPTTGQDPARARTTRGLIRALKSEGKTVFLTTHNMAEAEEICDRVGFLAQGTIPVTGTPDALKRQYGQRVLEVTTGGAGGPATRTFPIEGLGHNREFLEAIAVSEVIAMHTQEASLDDVFIKATGTASTGEADE